MKKTPRDPSAPRNTGSSLEGISTNAPASHISHVSRVPDPISLNPLRTHDRQTFYKHASGSTTLSILRHEKLRWSTPSLFNDPFDVPVAICDGIDEKILNHAVVD